MKTALDCLEPIRERINPPIAIILGSPAGVAQLVASLPTPDIVCYQMDLYQADRLREELSQVGSPAHVVASADLWDLPATFQTVLYPAPQTGERSLKLDMVEQAYHILRPRGMLVVLSPYEADQFFPDVLKKIYRRVHTPPVEGGTLLWCRREGDRQRRRHEMTFQARIGEGPSLRFLSRPGVFSYGQLDAGARALVETMTIDPGERVLDIGCGCGTNGIFAARQSGPAGTTMFLDSNVRAIALTELNAQANGLAAYRALASSQLVEPAAGDWDVVLANPPYYAQASIARLFIERARVLLRPTGRLYLVTKQADQVGPIMAETFGLTEAETRRGYTILSASA
jgi:16S rRNA (guanine1207-N2)-methyltransferase